MLVHRKLDITSPVGGNARDFILSRFLSDTTDVDVLIGTLGGQVVLISGRSFGQIEFMEHEVADYREYYYKCSERDQNVRASHRDIGSVAVS